MQRIRISIDFSFLKKKLEIIFKIWNSGESVFNIGERFNILGIELMIDMMNIFLK